MQASCTDILSQGVTQKQFEFGDEIIGDIANRHSYPDEYPDEISLLDNGNYLSSGKI